MTISADQENQRNGWQTRRDASPARDAIPGPVVAPPPKLRRRPMLAAVSAAAICLGALLAVWAYTSSTDAHEVVAIRSTVHRGDVITQADLMRARIGLDPSLKPIPGSELDAVIGKRAALDLAAGGLLTAEDVTSSVIPSQGQSVVGVSMAPGMIPGTQLRAGDRVRLVVTPGTSGDIGHDQPQTTSAMSMANTRRIIGPASSRR